MTTMQRILIIAAMTACASTLAAATPDRNRLVIYPVSYAELAPASEMVRALAGPEGQVTVDESGRRLMVIASTEQHKQIADALRTIDVAPRNVRIDVEFQQAGKSDESEASISGSGEIHREDGVTSGRIRVKPRIIDRTLTEKSRVSQSLMVASGREARLHVGERVPYVDWFVEYAHRHGYAMYSHVQWQDVGSFLVVQPTVIGDGPMIRVRLTPELSGLVEGRPLATTFAGLATDVVVQDGQSFQVGGLEQDQEFYSRFLTGSSRSGHSGNLVITITPHVLPAGGIPP